MRDLVEKGRALFESAAWMGSLRELSAEGKFSAFLLCRRLEAAAKARKEQLRDALMQEVAERGELTEKGGSRLLEFSEGAATRVRRLSSSPSVSRVRELLAGRELGPCAELAGKAVVTRTEVTEVVDASVLEAMVERGVLTAAEVEACYVETWAFNATEKRDAKAALAQIG